MRPPVHRWLTDLEQTACGQRQTPNRRRPLVVRGWPDVTCQRCLGSIHFKLEQLQRQPPGRPAEPQGPPAMATLTRPGGSQRSCPSPHGGPPLDARQGERAAAGPGALHARSRSIYPTLIGSRALTAYDDVDGSSAANNRL